MSGGAGNSTPKSQQILESLLTFELDKNVGGPYPQMAKMGNRKLGENLIEFYEEI